MATVGAGLDDSSSHSRPRGAARAQPVSDGTTFRVPWRLATRSGSCLPFGPTTSSTSSSISSCTTPRPTPTLSASSPSRAAPTSSPSAAWICAGSGHSDASKAVTTFTAATFPMAVPAVLSGLRHPERSQRERTRREDRRLQLLRDPGQPRWRWVARELQARSIEVRLCDPGQASALQGKRKRPKTDRLDARWLVLLLARELLPDAWLAPEDIQRLRDQMELTRFRGHLSAWPAWAGREG